MLSEYELFFFKIEYLLFIKSWSMMLISLQEESELSTTCNPKFWKVTYQSNCGSTWKTNVYINELASTTLHMIKVKNFSLYGLTVFKSLSFLNTKKQIQCTWNIKYISYSWNKSLTNAFYEKKIWCGCNVIGPWPDSNILIIFLFR